MQPYTAFVTALLQAGKRLENCGDVGLEEDRQEWSCLSDT